jgi:elongation factor G
MLSRISKKAFKSLQKASRLYATSTKIPIDEQDRPRLENLRNIGISAHIDSGKTTLTERILFYTGRIDAIHEVRGKDNIGATMDSMELEREKGITIQSAATYCTWKDMNINIIDTPGHVDFTIEVERALRVLDGAVLVLCAVGGVQSQTITVDRQMKRYQVPRLCFINKMDRAGANPWKVLEQIRQKLHLNCAAVQVPIGMEGDLKGVVDLVRWKAYYHQGGKGEEIVIDKVPQQVAEFAKEKRTELIEHLANFDPVLEDLYLEEKEPTEEQLLSAIRKGALELKFVPVFLGSAYHNKGVQPLLDGVGDYLPAPHLVENFALDTSNKEASVLMTCKASSPFVALAFKLEESRFGQLTFVRIYQGTLRRGDWVVNVRTNKKVKVPRLVRMHSNTMEDVESVSSGEICAMFGVECASGDTFSSGELPYSMTSMFVPQPVISLSLTPKTKDTTNFSKALQRFQREDPTFRVHVDNDTKQTIISGMGELHLEIYVERMKREYKVECVTGKPQVAFRETITKKIPFNYTHKKQSGGAGQFGKIMGYFEPIPESEREEGEIFEFVNETVGMNIPSNYIPAIEKGFKEICEQGAIVGHKLENLRVVLQDGAAHAVDSSELAFKLAAFGAFREFIPQAGPQILEPIMDVNMTAPGEYQGAVIALLNKRGGTIDDCEIRDEYLNVDAQVPLNNMFGTSTDLRSITQV